MIEVCPNCSNVDIVQLEAMVPADDFNVNCVGSCGSHPGKSVGFINGEFVETDTEEEFIEAVRVAIANE